MKKLDSRQLALKHLVEKGLEDCCGDLEQIVDPERGWDAEFSKYHIYVDAENFSDFWNGLYDIYGSSLLDDDYDFTIRLLPQGSMMIDLERLLANFGGVSSIWAKTERKRK